MAPQVRCCCVDPGWVATSAVVSDHAVACPRYRAEVRDPERVTIPATHEPPFALDGTVTRDKLLELLGVQTELPWLDYKVECDLSGSAGLVELAKDMGAMMIRGGYLVVGADGTGAAVGLPRQQQVLFDEATLAAKIARYVPGGFEVRSAVHDLDDGTGPMSVALVWVAPHPDGWCVFRQNGDYPLGGGRTRTAFRAGDVYARHGSRSEPWNQADIAVARAHLVAQEKDAWRAEHAEEMQRALQDTVLGAATAAGPSAAFTWQLDAAGFEATAVGLLRRDDDIPVRRMLRTAGADAQRLMQTGGDDALADVAVLLDRATTLAALGLELRRPAFTKMSVDALLGLYDWGLTTRYVQAPGQLPVTQLWLRIAERLYALGALAVRLMDWTAVRELALAPVAALQGEQRGRTWHRHALTEASRADLLQEDTPSGRGRLLSLLLFARAVAAANPALRPDLPGEVAPQHGGADPLLTAICQFDLLVTVISGVRAGATTERDLFSVSYPNFARADGSRANGVVLPLLATPEMRAALLPGATDEQIALVLHLADMVARRESQGFWGWEGYVDADVRSFIESRLNSVGP